MKTLVVVVGLVFSCLGFVPVRAQDVQYILNSRTGKFDAVRSAKFVQDNAANATFNGNRAVTRSGLPSINTGDTTLIDWLNNYFFPSTSPTATISVSGGNSREFMSSGAALTVTLSWGVTRPVACTPLQTITVNGISQTVNPLTEGQTQSGTLASQSLARNTNTTYTVNVASQDKTGTSSITVTWLWSRYWGAFVSAVPPTDGGFTISDTQIRALTGAGIGTGVELSTTRVKTYNNINAGGNYLVFAWPTAWGEPTFVINGLINTAFTKVRSNSAFVNASGGSTNYDVWVSNTTQASAITQFQIN